MFRERQMNDYRKYQSLGQLQQQSKKDFQLKTGLKEQKWQWEMKGIWVPEEAKVVVATEIFGGLNGWV